jgi:hypothetical protein
LWICLSRWAHNGQVVAFFNDEVDFSQDFKLNGAELVVFAQLIEDED